MGGKILFLVEGQTEEMIVKNLLAEHLKPHSLYPVPVIVSTKRRSSGEKHRGGFTSFPKLKKEVLNLLGDTSARAITTMFDFYGFPPIQGLAVTGTTCFEKVRCLEEAFAEEVGSPRFIPYLQLHEFEALLFSSPESMADYFPEYSRLLEVLRAILGQFGTPEEINDDPATSPAHRLKGLVPHYEKVHHGPEILSRIGLDPIKERCAHFASWLRTLEQLAG